MLLGCLAVLATVVVWLPFFLKLPSFGWWNLDFKEGMVTVWKNFDGPNYLIVAKSWYDKEIVRVNFSSPLPLEYYPAHLPFYPMLIYLFDSIFRGPLAMLLVTLLGDGLVFMIFYRYLESMGIKNKFFLGAIWLFLPARFLVVRSVGSPEPWFILFILLSLMAFKKEKYLLAGVWGALAQLTKSPGILLFFSYLVFILLERKQKLLKCWPLLLIPVSALGVFVFYQWQVGDFWAYFKSGDNFHFFWPPFSIFTPKGNFWTGDFWLEEIIWLWLIYGIGLLKVWRKGLRIESIFGGVFFLTTLFIAHRDIARYILPISPFVLIGWSDTLVKKEYRFLLLLLILPILLYSWQFMTNNVSPIADWKPYF